VLTCTFLERTRWNKFNWSSTNYKFREEHMCPACIASTAIMVAGVGSTGGILAVCIGKFRRFVRASSLGRFQKTKEK
jgi:hypothetical protein